jgi:hypothetical protein
VQGFKKACFPQIRSSPGAWAARILLDYPLGNTDAILPSAIVNIIGCEGYSGEVHYEGLEEVLKMDNATKFVDAILGLVVVLLT